MTYILYYTYEADTHCPGCARECFGVDPDHPDYKPGDSDENYIPFKQEDSEGNPIGVVFDTDENPARLSLADGGCTVSCTDCHGVIEDHRDYEREINSPAYNTFKS